VSADTVLDDRDSREAHYARALGDPRMLSTGDQLRTSCEAADARAAPPRRLVEFARGLGIAASVRSICRDDLTVILTDLLFEGLGRQLARVCPSSRLLPVDGVDSECRMTWQLPKQFDSEHPLTPVRCSDRPAFLSTPATGFPRTSEEGHVLCEVRRASVTRNPDGSSVVDGDGYYLMDGSLECAGGDRTAIEFTEAARPPHGTSWDFNCSKTACKAD
jgi:hypothetical protein